VVDQLLEGPEGGPPCDEEPALVQLPVEETKIKLFKIEKGLSLLP
jgi:hypothetical protein